VLMAKKVQLTKKVIQSIELAGRNQLEITDLTEPVLRIIKYANSATFIGRVFWKTKRYYIRLGNFPYLSIPTARQMAAQFKADVQSGEFNAYSQMKFKDFIYLHYQPKVLNTNKTALECMQRLENYFIPALGDMALGSITSFDITALLDERALELKPSTVNRYHSLIGSVFSVAIEKGYIDENKSPLKGIKKRKENNTHQKKLPTKDQVKLLISLCNKNIGKHAIYDLLLLLIYTGMRVSEALSLRKGDIEQDGTVIWIEENKSDRPFGLPINSQAKVVVNRLLSNTHNEHLFPSAVLTNKPIIPPHRMLHTILEPLGLSEFGFHYCRAIFCTAVAKNNAHMAQKLLNHSDIKTTNLYIYHDHNTLMEASEAVVDLYHS
jgi:integrase